VDETEQELLRRLENPEEHAAEPLTALRLGQQPHEAEGQAEGRAGRYFLGVRGTAQFCKALKHNTTVVELDLAGHRICDDGAEILAEVLKVNDTLKVLDAANNKIHAGSAAVMAEALRTNCRLADLSLRDNSIGDQGCARASAIEFPLSRTGREREKDTERQG